jgi:hypothetical protein
MDHPETPPPEPAPPQPTESPATPPARKKADAEQLAQRLRTEVRKKRPHVFGWLALVVLLLAGLAGVLVWWMWPRPAPPRLAVIAFDQLLEPLGERREVVAQLVRVDAGTEPVPLAGFEVYFQERGAVLLPNAPVRSVRAVSDADGRVTAPPETTVPEGILTVIARHAIPRPRHSSEDTARLFFKPKGTRYCVVELGALTLEPNPKWGGVPVDQIKIREGAAAALAKAAKEGSQIVYLAMDLERPEAYRAVRGWIQYQAGNVRPALPNGPVLCRFLYGANASTAEARAQLLKDVEVLAPDRASRLFVTAEAKAAEEYARVGSTSLLGGNGPPSSGITRIATWAEFRK